MPANRRLKTKPWPPGDREELVKGAVITAEEAKIPCPWPREARIEWWERRIMACPGSLDNKLAQRVHGVSMRTAYDDMHTAEDRARPVYNTRRSSHARIFRLYEHAIRLAIQKKSVTEIVAAGAAMTRLLRLELTPDELMNDTEARSMIAKAVAENVSSFTVEQRASMMKALSKPAKK